VLVVVDCDCTFAPDAISRLVAPFVEPDVGAVAGAVLVRNAEASVMASLQSIEYLFSIQLGRTLLDHLDMVSCVSGAMGAFRRSAWDGVGGMDVGPGEDFDITLKLRRHGFRIRFAGDALCETDVPETLGRFLKQRRRWERDAFRLRIRKHGYTLNPFSQRFRLIDALHQIEFLLYGAAAAVVFLIYLTVLATEAPDLVPIVLVFITLVLVVLDAAFLVSAALVLGQWRHMRLLPFVPLFAPFQFLVMRNARLAAYVEELIFSTSRKDDFVPERVRRWSTWH
jgi:cellulose synthase/poly-beta-1,6-N-acetylglucosamine synthase-like glycosyltransferase